MEGQSVMNISLSRIPPFPTVLYYMLYHTFSSFDLLAKRADFLAGVVSGTWPSVFLSWPLPLPLPLPLPTLTLPFFSYRANYLFEGEPKPKGSEKEGKEERKCICVLRRDS